jgi:hypothetical protein
VHLGAPTLVVPVSDLLNGPQIRRNPVVLADLTKGRLVQALATDGVAQVVIRLS